MRTLRPLQPGLSWPKGWRRGLVGGHFLAQGGEAAGTFVAVAYKLDY